MRRELRDTYYRSQQEKQARQADEMMNKFAERNRVDQAYEDYKYKQQDHEEKVKVLNRFYRRFLNFFYRDKSLDLDKKC